MLKRIIYILVLVFCLSKVVIAQNLVPNYSFEENIDCGQSMYGLDSLCKYWFTPMIPTSSVYEYPFGGSSDFFHPCNTFPNGVPYHPLPLQYAKTDSAFAGFGLVVKKNNWDMSYKEYLEARLKKVLSKDFIYYFELYYSSRNEVSVHNNYFSYNIQALLSNQKKTRNHITSIFYDNIYASPQISQQITSSPTPNVWNKVSGTFTAQGGEEYLTIGNFEQIAASDTGNTYVYIDDVTLICIDSSAKYDIDTLVIPNVFTPNGDGFNDRFEFKNQEDWSYTTYIYNRWGSLIYKDFDSNSWDGTYKGKDISEGVYFFVVEGEHISSGYKKEYQGTITVMR